MDLSTLYELMSDELDSLLILSNTSYITSLHCVIKRAIQQTHNVETKLIQHQDVKSTLFQCCVLLGNIPNTLTLKNAIYSCCRWRCQHCFQRISGLVFDVNHSPAYQADDSHEMSTLIFWLDKNKPVQNTHITRVHLPVSSWEYEKGFLYLSFRTAPAFLERSHEHIFQN